MGEKTGISWTDSTWTPIRARVKADAPDIARAKGYDSLVQIAEKMVGHVGQHCEHVSTGWVNCYSDTFNSRCLPFNGTGLPFDRRSRDLVDIFLDEKILAQPSHWRKPRMIFVCSQTDLFGEFVTDEMIDRVFGVMASCRQHTFQVLTKRPERMLAYLRRFKPDNDGFVTRDALGYESSTFVGNPTMWPLPNVWLGVSVENQAMADERIPLLEQTPAVARFISAEPLLGALDLEWPVTTYPDGPPMCCSGRECGCHGLPTDPPLIWKVDLCIIGGESGPKARPCDVAWIRSLMAQCRKYNVSPFVKQLGAHVIQDGERRIKKAHKGEDMDEWPHDLRVREMPEVKST